MFLEKGGLQAEEENGGLAAPVHWASFQHIRFLNL
jgi:hypothetical protein